MFTTYGSWTGVPRTGCSRRGTPTVLSTFCTKPVHCPYLHGTEPVHTSLLVKLYHGLSVHGVTHGLTVLDCFTHSGGQGLVVHATLYRFVNNRRQSVGSEQVHHGLVLVSLGHRTGTPRVVRIDPRIDGPQRCTAGLCTSGRKALVYHGLA